MIEKKNPWDYSKDPELYQIFSQMTKLETTLENKFKKAESMMGISIEELKFQKPIDIKVDLYDFKTARNPYSSYSRKETLDNIKINVNAAIKVAEEQINICNEQNKPIVEHNEKVKTQIKQLMERLGITAQYETYAYATTRSKSKTKSVHSAGYITDLNRICQYSNVSSCQSQLTTYINCFNSWHTSELAEEAKKLIDDDEAEVKKNIINNPALVAALMQADVNIIEQSMKAQPGQKAKVIKYCIAQAIKNVTDKNKYLNLAYNLEIAQIKSRSNNVTAKEIFVQASNLFTPTNDEDANIVTWLNYRMNNWPLVTSFISFNDKSEPYTFESIFGLVNDQTSVGLIKKLIKLSIDNYQL